MIKAFKYRLYPTKEQTKKLNETTWLCSIVYNRCLEDRQNTWKAEQKTLSRYDQILKLPIWKKEDPRLTGVYGQVLQDVAMRVDRAFQSFFQRVKNGEKPGYPRFRSARRYDSFTYTQKGFRLVGNRIKLTKIGCVKVVLHRPLEGKIKTLTILRQADGWYACFACEVNSNPMPTSDRAAGVDLGLESFAITSDGEFFPAAKYLRKAEHNLKRLQRQVSRRTKGSARRKKAIHLLRKAHLRVKNQRRDTAHKVARSLINRYGTIAVEKLPVFNMLHNHNLAKGIGDAGWSLFVNILKAKAVEAGRQVIEVDPRYTSQICSGCGSVEKKTLAQRWHNCQGCGTSLHRDVNAAINILRKAVA